MQHYAAHTILISHSDCVLQCYAAHTILISRPRLYFSMLCCLQHLNTSTETVFDNAVLPTPYWFLESDCMLQCYAAHIILISRLRLYFVMLYLHNLDIATESVFCNALLLTPSWYLDSDCILLNNKITNKQGKSSSNGCQYGNRSPCNMHYN